MNEAKKESYQVFAFRLNSETYDLLKKTKKENGKSWNLFLYEILLEHINKNGQERKKT